jgi:hypothetical protein
MSMVKALAFVHAWLIFFCHYDGLTPLDPSGTFLNAISSIRVAHYFLHLCLLFSMFKTFFPSSLTQDTNKLDCLTLVIFVQVSLI